MKEPSKKALALALLDRRGDELLDAAGRRRIRTVHNASRGHSEYPPPRE